MNMFTAHLRSALALLGLALLTVIPSSAQEHEIEPDPNYGYDTAAYVYAPETPRSAVMKEFESKVAWKVLDYWSTQLNHYKSRIDGTVSDCDLAELNRLRVFWSMFLDEKKWEGLVDGVDDIFGSDIGSSYQSGSTEVAVVTPVPYDYEYTATDTAVMAYADAYVADTISLVPGYPADVSGFEPEAEATIAIGGDYDESAGAMIADTASVALSGDYSGDYGSADAVAVPEGDAWQPPTPEEIEQEMTETLAFVDRVSEVAETFFVAKWIARRYRPQFDKIREDMVVDMRGFIDTILVLKENFEREHAAEIAADPEAMQVMEEITREQAEKALLELGSEKSVVMMYNVLIEPLLLLYNGQDLRRLLTNVDVLPEEIAQLSLPEMSALRQNVPNPASTATTITYVLDEPSSRTTLRLYNSRGDLMSSTDLGYRSAGEHQAEIDVAKFPVGSYLYHLTVQGEKGERVYSKTMQVVR